MKSQNGLSGVLCLLTAGAALCWHGPYAWRVFGENAANVHVERFIIGSNFNAADIGANAPQQQIQWVHDVYNSKSKPSAGRLSMMGFLALGEHRTQDAINCWEKAQAIQPPRPTIVFNLGQLYDRLGRRDEALTLYRLSPESAGVFLIQGHTALESNDWNKAALAYGRAYEIDCRSDQTQFFMAEVENYHRRDHKAAILLYKQAIQSGYPDGFIWSRIAHAYAMTAQYSEALVILDRHLQDNALANAIRGDAYRASGRSIDAILAYQSSLTQEGNNPWVWLNFGYAYLQAGDRERANDAWRQALLRVPDFAPAKDALSR